MGILDTPSVSTSMLDSAIAQKLSDPVSTTATTLAASYAPQRKFTGVDLTVYGHSYTLADGTFVTQGSEYFALLKKRYGFTTMSSYGVGGMIASEVFRVMNVGYSKGSTAIRPIGAKGVTVLHCMFNDVTRAGTTDPTKCLDRFKHSLRASLACLTSSGKITAYGSGSVTRVGTFTLLGQGASREWLGSAYSSTVGDYIEFTVTGDTVHILGFAWDLAQANNAPIIEVKVDGVVKTTLNHGNNSIVQYSRITDGFNSVNSPRIDTISGMGAGTHTLRLTLMAGSVGQWHTEAVYGPSITPSPVAVIVDPLPTPNASMYATHVANRPAFKAAAIAVASEFPSATVVDLGEMSSVSTYFNADYIHPNDKGAGWEADLVGQQFISKITRPLDTLYP